MNIAGFFIVLIVTILAFGQMGKILFGEKLANFRTITSSVISVLDLLMGNLDYDALHRIHPQMAPLYLFIIIIGILGILQVNESSIGSIYIEFLFTLSSFTEFICGHLLG